MNPENTKTSSTDTNHSAKRLPTHVKPAEFNPDNAPSPSVAVLSTTADTPVIVAPLANQSATPTRLRQVLASVLTTTVPPYTAAALNGAAYLAANVHPRVALGLSSMGTLISATSTGYALHHARNDSTLPSWAQGLVSLFLFAAVAMLMSGTVLGLANPSYGSKSDSPIDLVRGLLGFAFLLSAVPAPILQYAEGKARDREEQAKQRAFDERGRELGEASTRVQRLQEEISTMAAKNAENWRAVKDLLREKQTRLETTESSIERLEKQLLGSGAASSSFDPNATKTQLEILENKRVNKLREIEELITIANRLKPTLPAGQQLMAPLSATTSTLFSGSSHASMVAVGAENREIIDNSHSSLGTSSSFT